MLFWMQPAGVTSCPEVWRDAFPSNLFVQNAMQTLQQWQPGFWKYYFQMIFHWTKQMALRSIIQSSILNLKKGKRDIFWSDEVLKPRSTANDVTKSAIMVQCKMIHYQSHWLSEIVLCLKTFKHKTLIMPLAVLYGINGDFTSCCALASRILDE